MIDLDELRKLAEAATPGPWSADHNGNPRNYEDWYGATLLSAPYSQGQANLARNLGSIDESAADAEFIAAANPATVLALIERVRETEGALVELDDEFAQYQEEFGRD